ncbi:hypothetical protein J4Q44_G00098140 [Coregonus suidteri]|uniref:Histone deacetylase complex subunit SAP130 C-terminal domain-containing protein n=1 Tax=Coregonus suidteri TaxID=861788 RepID=A0AAN8RBD1_9TELE
MRTGLQATGPWTAGLRGELWMRKGMGYVPVRPRPPVTLLRHYRNPWKAAYHHSQRYSDIKVKEDKGSLQDGANQRGVVAGRG